MFAFSLPLQCLFSWFLDLLSSCHIILGEPKQADTSVHLYSYLHVCFQLAWNSISFNKLFPTNDTLELRATNVPRSAEARVGFHNSNSFYLILTVWNWHEQAVFMPVTDARKREMRAYKAVIQLINNFFHAAVYCINIWI